MVFCACGCGGVTKTVITTYKNGRINVRVNKYLFGHQWKGKPRPICFVRGNKFGQKFTKGHTINNGKHRSLKTEIKKQQHLSPATEFKKGHTPANPFRKNDERTKAIRRSFHTPLKDTSIEIKIQKFLKELNINFYTHQYMGIKHDYQCDIFIPSLNVVIECDGNHWHNYPNGTGNDKIRTQELQQRGYKVLRFWEHEIKKMEINQLKEKLTEVKNGQ